MTQESAEARSRYRQPGVPLNRWGEEADEISKVVLFLASDDFRYVQGSEILVDGGVTGAKSGAPVFRAAPADTDSNVTRQLTGAV